MGRAVRGGRFTEVDRIDILREGRFRRWSSGRARPADLTDRHRTERGTAGGTTLRSGRWERLRKRKRKTAEKAAGVSAQTEERIGGQIPADFVFGRGRLSGPSMNDRFDLSRDRFRSRFAGGERFESFRLRLFVEDETGLEVRFFDGGYGACG